MNERRRAATTLGFITLLALAAGCGKTSKSRGSHAADGTDGIGAAAGASSVADGGSAGSGGSSASGGSGGSAGAALAPCDEGSVGTSQIPRLTRADYDRTIRDLLGVTELTAFEGQPPSALLGSDHAGDLTELDWRGYMIAGEAIAVQVMANAELRTRFMACTPTGDGVACLRETIVNFGRRAFRRPLTDSELQRFERFVTERGEITRTGAAEEVAEVILNTFLVSPSFIQRSEVTAEPDGAGRFVLSSYEVAARLSYMLWGSTPDTVLEKAADADELQTPEQIRAQAERMIADPKARELVVGFHRAYLDRVPGAVWENAQKDTAAFPEFTEAVVRAMNEETDRFFEAVIFDEAGSFSEIFTSPLAFVNRDTAPLYGLDPADFDAALEPVHLDAAERPGAFTRVGFLAAYASDTHTSPTRRGAFIAQRILGMELGSQPPTHGSFNLDRAAFETNRAFVEAQTAPAECSACHTLIDPFGFALEAYDAIGRRQTHDAATGAPIDTSAAVTLDGGPVSVTGPDQLMAAIGASDQARLQYVRAWLTHAYGWPAGARDECIEQRLFERLTDAGYTVLDLLMDLTQSEAFRLRTLVEDEP